MSLLASLSRITLAGALLVLGSSGCADDPPMAIRYELSAGPTQMCPADCSGVDLRCKAALSVRIVDPVTKAEHFSLCRELESAENLCKITSVRLLSPNELPARRLAVQVALYNLDDVSDPVTKQLSCPADLPFDANNFAAPSPYQPAVAGQGYYEPGEAETVITLGCADTPVVNTPACRGDDLIQVTASVDDFDSGVYLQPPTSNNVTLQVGEPQEASGELSGQYEFSLDKLKTLDRVVNNIPGPGAWSASMEKNFTTWLCIIVLERVNGSTATASCQHRPRGGQQFDLRGLRLRGTTLADLQQALGLGGAVPSEGLVVGMVVDAQGKPVEGVTVRPSGSATVKYLGPDRDNLVSTATSSSGIFLSQDAPFTTSWSAAGTSGGYGGLIRNHVTVVILQPDAASVP
jgi:hypothetical protein